MISKNGNLENHVPANVKFNLDIVSQPKPYNLCWLHKDDKIKVNFDDYMLTLVFFEVQKQQVKVPKETIPVLVKLEEIGVMIPIGLQPMRNFPPQNVLNPWTTIPNKLTQRIGPKDHADLKMQ